MDLCPKTCRSDRNGLISIIGINIVSSVSSMVTIIISISSSITINKCIIMIIVSVVISIMCSVFFYYEYRIFKTSI